MVTILITRRGFMSIVLADPAGSRWIRTGSAG